jgi:hypothetical protein
MKLLLFLIILIILTAIPVAAQDGPIARSVARQYARPDVTTTYSTEMRSPALFWAGAALVAAGAVVSVAGFTWERESDLSLEDPNTRLGRDLAPCRTDPSATRLDCRLQGNTGLIVPAA